MSLIPQIPVQCSEDDSAIYTLFAEHWTAFYFKYRTDQPACDKPEMELYCTYVTDRIMSILCPWEIPLLEPLPNLTTWVLVL